MSWRWVVFEKNFAQVSYAVNRKFLWMWAYEKTADGTLYINITLDHPEDYPGIHRVTQVSRHRWNHHVEVKSLEKQQVNGSENC